VIPFVKMHGCGNDFIVVRENDLRVGSNEPAAGDVDPEDATAWVVQPDVLARRVCDRHFGIGADGLLLFGPRPPQDGVPRLRMLYWNADGSRAEMCGNGARCVVRLAVESGDADAPLVLETDAGPRAATIVRTNDRPIVEIDMGAPVWDPVRVPVRSDQPVTEAPFEVEGTPLGVTALSMGNPHAVVFVADRAALASVPLDVWGRGLAVHPSFPRGANASFVAVAQGELYVRTWERGVGATLACGTATCATFAAARRSSRIAAEGAVVHLPGGRVEVRRTPDDHLWLCGPATFVAEGVLSAEWLDT
jgi:diaminopimelate epimerase